MQRDSGFQTNDNISSALTLKMLEWASMNFFNFGIDGGFFTLDPTMVILTGVPFDCRSFLMSCRNLAASGPARQQGMCQDSCSSAYCVCQLRSYQMIDKLKMRTSAYGTACREHTWAGFQLGDICNICPLRSRLNMICFLWLGEAVVLVLYDPLVPES